ncbi:hypothetical protein [Phyllobacterium ifriqiyense]|uniref:hypothetical protein n=1 Tax=Phyllobacterium ifriqiyense TaxID=314238 RepID=UPI0033972834
MPDDQSEEPDLRSMLTLHPQRQHRKIEQFQEKCVAVFRPELRKNKDLERRFESIKTQNALVKFPHPEFARYAGGFVLFLTAGPPAKSCSHFIR